MTAETLLPIVKSVAGAASAASKVTPGPLRVVIGNTLADVWQGIVGDRIAAWRILNAGEVSRQVSQKLAKSGVTLDRSKISDRFAFAWFEEASKQDEPELQELFATLLANAALGIPDALEKRNIDLISRMGPKDAQLLGIIIDNLVRQPNLFNTTPIIYFRAPEYRFLEKIKRDNGFEDSLALESLQRLGIVDREIELNTMGLNNHFEEMANAIETQVADRISQLNIMTDLVEITYNISLSKTGYSLAKALSPESFPEPATK